MGFRFNSDEFQAIHNALSRQRELCREGEHWAIESVRFLDKIAREHLESQGRGGQPPPLSPMTRKIYNIRGEPDGSGLRNHLEVKHSRNKGEFTAIFGVPQGRPTIIAKTQDQGAIIPVTDAMRGYFAATYGIGLKASTKHIYIPARYWWSHSTKRAKARAKRNLIHLFRKAK